MKRVLSARGACPILCGRRALSGRSPLGLGPLVRCLALAILANSGSADALRALREEVEEHLWASLRALRISMVLDPRIVAKLLNIVREGF